MSRGQRLSLAFLAASWCGLVALIALAPAV
jgi:hypothetical protein